MLSSFWGYLYFEVVFIFRLSSSWGHLHFKVVFIWGRFYLRMAVFWGRLHFEIVNTLMSSSFWGCLNFEFFIVLERACGVPVGRRSGGRLAMTLVANISYIIFTYNVCRCVCSQIFRNECHFRGFRPFMAPIPFSLTPPPPPPKKWMKIDKI